MQTERLRELQLNFEQERDFKLKISALLDWCAEMRLYDVDKALELAEQALQLATTEEFQLGIGRSYYAMAFCHWQKGVYDLGIQEIEQGLLIAKKISDKKLKAKCHNILGNIYRDKGQVNDALRNFLLALDTFEQLKDDYTSGVVMKNIANLHTDLYDYDSAEEYAIRSVKILEQHENPFRLFHSYATLGNIYFKKENYDNALKYFYKCNELAEPNTITHALAVSGLGKVYFQMANFDKSKNYLMHAFTTASKNSFVEPYIIAAFYLGRWHESNNHLDEALDFYQKALDSSVEHGRRHDMMSVHERMADLFENKKNYELAFSHLKAFEELRAQIFKQEEITKLKNLQVYNELAFAKKEKVIALQTATLKQQFMANMSHEIRTPMNAIIGMSRLLTEKEHLPGQEKYLNAIQRSADNLLVIINDILDVSKLEAGKFSLENIPFDLRSTLQAVYDILSLKALEKRIGFTTDIEERVPKAINGDATRLTQILINLASNAIKFTDKGTVCIKVRVKHLLDQKVVLKFEVEDTGVGISEEYINSLFEKFTQAGTDIARKYGGTGLGLSISKQLVNLMQGEISVKSKIGEGSTFTIEIPFDIAEESAVQYTNKFQITTKNKERLQSLYLLLVEDNEFNQMLAIDTLKDIAPNITIDLAINGKEAIEQATKTVYDLILMDVQMPEMNGVDATIHIRSMLPAPNKDVKIMAMTANVFQEDITNYLASGMNEYISKPFNTDSLIHKILKLVGSELPEGYVPKPIEPPTSSATGPLLDLTFLGSFTKGDEAKQKKYIQLFLDNAPKMVQQAETAVQNNDGPALKIAAHSLKSQLNYMGVKESISGVQALEKSSQNPDEAATWPAKTTKLKQVCEQVFKELEQVIKDFG